MPDTDEALKTLRFLNQLLTLLATAVFLFGMTPDPTRDYNAALDELSALRAITDSWTDYAQYLHERFKGSQASDEDFLLEAVREAGASLGKPSEFMQPFACDCVPTGFSLSSYDAFLSGVRAFAPIQIDRSKNLSSQLRAQVAAQKPHPGFTLVRASFNGLSGSFQLPDGTPVIRLSDPPPHETAVQFTFDDRYKQRPSFSANTFVTYSVGPRQEGTFALDWLRATKTGGRLVDLKSVVFPHLKKLSFWNRISPLGVEQATASVQAQLERVETGKVSFLGISVDKTLSVWLGPSVCFAVLFFFLLHLRHYRSLVESEGIDDSYPWVPLFPGTLSGVFSFFLVLVLPTISNLTLLYNYGDAHQWSTRVGLTVTVGIAVLGIFSWWNIRSIRFRVT